MSTLGCPVGSNETEGRACRRSRRSQRGLRVISVLPSAMSSTGLGEGRGGGWTVGSLAHESSPGVRWYKPMSIWFEGKNLCTISKKNHLKKKDVKPAQAASSAKGNKRWEGTADTAATALAHWGRRRCTAPSGTPLLRPAAPPPTEDAG